MFIVAFVVNPCEQGERTLPSVTMPIDLDEARAWLVRREERRQRALDLVVMEHIEPEYAALIREKGVLVYDREQPDPGPHFRV